MGAMIGAIYRAIVGIVHYTWSGSLHELPFGQHSYVGWVDRGTCWLTLHWDNIQLIEAQIKYYVCFYFFKQAIKFLLTKAF